MNENINYNLSICTTIKNRCIIETEYGKKHIFKNFLESLENLKDYFIYNNIKCELIVADFYSDDIQNFEEYISFYLKNIRFKIIKIQENFSRGKGLNIAIKNSSYENLLILDADMKFNENLFNNVLKHTIIGEKAYFPICYTYERDHLEKNGFWLDVGYGNFSAKKEHIDCSGMIPEYKSWGSEDLDFYNKIIVEKIRENCEGLIHVWHPLSIEWKNRFY